MSNSLIEQLINKMGLKDEAGVLQKTTELLRLLDLRANSNVICQVNEYGKIVLCADIAASTLGIPIDKDQAIKLASLRKTQYGNCKRLFEKLLDMNRVLGVRDICIQLGLSEMEQKASDLLEFYHKTVASEVNHIDVEHPQYAAMAVFQACKLHKVKIAKPKILPYSNLRPTQWMALEQRWYKLIEEQYKQKHMNNANNQDKEDLTSKLNNDAKSLHGSLDRKSEKTSIEDYEQWKDRMLKMAESKLKSLEEQHEQKMNKENLH